MASLHLVLLLTTFIFLGITGEEKVTDEDEKVPTKDVSEGREGKQEGSKISLMALAMIARASVGNSPFYEEEFSIEQELPVTDEKPDHMMQLEPETGIDVEAEDVEATDEEYKPHLEPDLGKDIEDTTSMTRQETPSTTMASTTSTTSSTSKPQTSMSTPPSQRTTTLGHGSEKLGTESKCGIKSNPLAFIVCTAFILIFIR